MEARKILKKLEAASKEQYISPVNYAKIHHALGTTDFVLEMTR